MFMVYIYVDYVVFFFGRSEPHAIYGYQYWHIFNH